MFARTGWRGHVAQTAAETVALALKGHKCGNGWTACCPAHDDHDPSLSIREGDAGRALLHCFAGCRQEDIIAALKGAAFGRAARHAAAEVERYDRRPRHQLPR
jgi:putative DNA primase/helicase